MECSNGSGARTLAAAALVALVATGAALATTSNARARPGSTVPSRSKLSYLWVSDAHAGTLVPRAERGEYTLTLTGVHSTATYFADRPAKEVGSVSLRHLLAGLFHKPGEAPPNAAINALVPQRGNHQYTMGVTLLSAHYDPARQEISYRVRRLPQGPSTRQEHGRTDVVLPRTFGHTSVFIDDGGNTCQATIQNLTNQPLPQEAWPNNVGKWSTDNWAPYPSDTIGYVPNPNQLSTGYGAGVAGEPGVGPTYASNGGASRGCHNWVNLTYPGGTIQFSLTDPYSGSNTVTCDVDETDADYQFQCGYFIGYSTTGGDNINVEFFVCSANPAYQPWEFQNVAIGSTDGCTAAGTDSDSDGGAWFAP